MDQRGHVLVTFKCVAYQSVRSVGAQVMQVPPPHLASCGIIAGKIILPVLVIRQC
jgi:hypothetical protein